MKAKESKILCYDRTDSTELQSYSAFNEKLQNETDPIAWMLSLTRSRAYEYRRKLRVPSRNIVAVVLPAMFFAGFLTQGKAPVVTVYCLMVLLCGIAL